MRRAAVALLAAFLLSGCGAQVASNSAPTTTATGPSGAAPAGGTFMTVPLTKDILQLPLVDQAGHTFSLGTLHGKYVVIANFMTTCQEICPMTSANMRRIGDAVAAAKRSGTIAVLEISIDAQRDTPARLRAYQRLYGDQGSWTLATGSAENLQKLWTFFGAPAQRTAFSAAEIAKRPKDWQTGQPVTYDMSHADLVLILDPKGNWCWLDLGAPQTADGRIPAKLQQFLSADGRSALAKPEQPAWTADAVLAALSTLTGRPIKA